MQRDIREVVTKRRGSPNSTVDYITEDKKWTEKATVLKTPGNRNVPFKDSTYLSKVI